MEKIGEVANLLLSTDDNTILLCYVKPRSFSNLTLPPQQYAVPRTFRVYLFSYPDSLLHFDRSASLSTRPVASLLSCGLTLRFHHNRLSRRYLCDVRYKYMTCRAGIGQTPSALFTLQAEPSRTDPNRSDSAVRSSTYVLFIPLQLF